MFDSFLNRPTWSINKNRNEQQLHTLLTKMRAELSETCVVTLVGDTSGLDRHYQLFKPFFKKMYICERCPVLANKLQREVTRKRLENVVVYSGDFFETVRILHEKGIKIGLLDFDGVQRIGTNEDELLKLAKLVNANIVVNIGSARGQHENFKKWCADNKKRRTVGNEFWGLRYELKRLGPEYIKDKTHGFVSNFKTYRGTQNMWQCVMVKPQFKTQLEEVYNETR